MLKYLNEEELPVGVSGTEETAGAVAEETASATPAVAEPVAQEIATEEDAVAEPVAQEIVTEETTLAEPVGEVVDAPVGTADAEEAGAMGIPGAVYAPADEVPTLGDGECVLSVRNLSKSYKKGEYILKNFSLDIAKGQIIGLLGPNGCGKTTLLKLVAGLLVADEGTIEVAGAARSELSNRDISYLPERTYFTPGMKVTALLDYFADFYDDFDRALAESMLADLDIPMGAKLRTLSKGMKEKVQLVLVMSRKTKLYLLDEPIGGVDPAAREYVLNTILARYNTNASVIITTHLISDIEPVLDSFAFLGYGGELIAYGQAENAREQTGKSLDELFREVFRCYRKP